MNRSKQQQLRHHKRIATGLFFLMAVLYGVMIYLQTSHPAVWMGYVEAFAEAGMVGALADWFAVTALFKHPLRLPIPHTNLIQHKQRDLGNNLGKFVNDNFLNPKTIRPYIEKIDFSKHILQWLDKPKNQEGLSQELKVLLLSFLNDLDDEQVTRFINQKGSELLQSIDVQALAGNGINYLLKQDEHQQLLNHLLPQLTNYIEENQRLIQQRLADSKPFISFLAGKKISNEVTKGLVNFMREVEEDSTHFVRQKLTEELENLARDIQENPKWRQKIKGLQTKLITPENIEKYTVDAWLGIKSILQEQLQSPQSPLDKQLQRSLQNSKASLEKNHNLQKRIDGKLRVFLYRMVLRNRQEVETLISQTVAHWDGKELSRKLELEVGKDLQYIRLNGTLVGGLVGLIIYAITHFFIG